MKAVIPVAGNGTRMFPLGVTTPKALIKILNKPLIQWTLEALAENSIDEVIIVVSGGSFGQKIQTYIEQEIIAQKLFPFTIHMATQEQQLGTAHVLQLAESFFEKNEEFLYMYGDDLYGPKNISAVLKAPSLSVIGKKVSDPEKWGIFQTDAKNLLIKVVEKPSEFVGDLANIGCMKLDTRVFKLYAGLEVSVRGEYEITDTLQLLAKHDVTVLPAEDYWIPIGYPWHVIEATEYFLQNQQSRVEGTVSADVTQTGTLTLPKSSTVLAGCHLEGNILVGEGVTIGPNARILGNTAIGNHTTIGFSVEIDNSVIGDNTSIQRLAFIGTSVLGNNITIAGGTMLVNTRNDERTIETLVKGAMIDTKRTKFGAVIGDQVKLGANTTVYPGRKIWPGISTRPGQIVDKDLQQ